MSALCKPGTMNAGHRQAYLHDLLVANHDLSADARLLLCVLTLHHGDQGVYPGLRRLSAMSGLTIARVREARDELEAVGIISYTIGTGRRPTLYRLIGLEDWFAGRSGCGKPEPAPVVACEDQVVSVSPVGTKPLEPFKKDAPVENVVPMIPSVGWRGIVARAPADYRRHWLGQVQFTANEQDDITLRAPTSLHADRLRRDLEPGGVLHDLVLAVGIDPEAVTVTGPKCGRDPHAGRAVREGDADGYDPQRSAGRQFRQWADEAAGRIEARSDGADVVSMAGWRARRDGWPE